MKNILFTFLLLLGAVVTAFSQIEISGTVTDKDGEPLFGVTVLPKGTVNGTVTDILGAYKVKVSSDNTVLVFSYIGYASVEKSVSEAESGTLNVTMGEDAALITGIEVVGSRNPNRSALETATPVDIIPISQLTNSVGQLDMNQLLQFAAPSFNSNRQSGSDGADHIDPATLRGLGPDQTLVLVNGKRYHQSSLVNLYGTRGRGNTGTDLNTIPASAIERIEILRDGAAAQYGSDAIAGVINIVLKKSVNEFTGNITGGITQEGDGENLQINGNYGFAIGEKGYVNVTADWLHRGRTQRNAVMDDGSLYRRRFGDAKQEGFNGIFNAAIPIGETAEVYASGGIGHRNTDAYAYTRSADSPRNIPEIYPNGFDPRILSTIKDHHFSAGVRGKLGVWNADFSNTNGSNDFHYYVDSTLNASMLAVSPTRFDAGGFTLNQNTTNLDFNRKFDVLNGINLAFGSEFRSENYKIYAGEEGSWKNYGGTYIDEDSVTQNRPGGSQGFPGYQPSNVLNETRTNFGLYTDAEFDFTDAFTLAAAARFERYSDFGNTLNAKLAMRYAFNDNFAIRGSVSTGFRAPSLAQIYFNSTFTNVISGVPVDVVLAKNNSSLTQALGVGRLKQEKSLNAGLGFTAKTNTGFSLTLDGYLIDIKDRIVLSGTFSPDSTTSWGRTLLAQNVGGIQFFANALDTRSIGLDLILAYNLRMGEHRLGFTLAGNYNSMTLGALKVPTALIGQEETFFGEREKRFLLASAPKLKGNLSIDYKIAKFYSSLRFNYFHKVLLQDWTGADDLYKAQVTADLSLGYSISKNVSLTIGASNLLNTLPTLQDIETETGGRYDAVQMGFGGAFYFARLGVKF